jgi:hypothetical protein
VALGLQPFLVMRVLSHGIADLPVARVAELWLRHPLLNRLGAERCAALAVSHPAVWHEVGAEVAATETPAGELHVLLDGTVALYQQSREGLLALTRLLQAPSVFGEVEVFHRVPSVASARVVVRAVRPVAS